MVDGNLVAFADRFRRPAGAKRAAHPGAYRGPTLPATWEAFSASLAGVGGALVGCEPSVSAAVESFIDLQRGPGRIVACAAAAPWLARANGWSPAGMPAPHAWEDVDLAIVTAELACAENAALLISSAVLPERALAFLAQRLLVLVPPGRLVGGFMEAQETLARRIAEGEQLHHATWVSGPSKTADIEQTLVIGAHGVCSLAVMPLPGA
jgi:hypothetical protein